MDIGQSYQLFSQTVQSLVQSSGGSVALSRPDPSKMHNKAYRDVMVSQNILRKSLQLYNDITTAQTQRAAKFTEATDYLSEIKAGSLQDLLQSYVQTDIRDVIAQARGQGLDQSD